MAEPTNEVFDLVVGSSIVDGFKDSFIEEPDKQSFEHIIAPHFYIYIIPRKAKMDEPTKRLHRAKQEEL